MIAGTLFISVEKAAFTWQVEGVTESFVPDELVRSCFAL